MINYMRKRRIFPIFFVLALIASGCGLSLVAQYDAATEEAIFKCAKMVDQFYGDLLEKDEDQRRYADFADRYVTVETEIKALMLRNKVRSLNEDSTKITENILKLWIEAKNQHKTANTYSTANARLDRDRFTRMFAYAVRAEKAKPE